MELVRFVNKRVDQRDSMNLGMSKEELADENVGRFQLHPLYYVEILRRQFDVLREETGAIAPDPLTRFCAIEKQSRMFFICSACLSVCVVCVCMEGSCVCVCVYVCGQILWKPRRNLTHGTRKLIV